MYASTQNSPVRWSLLARWAGRICGVTLVVAWVALFAMELTRPGFQAPARTFAQGVALAVVFAGYAIGWKREVVGGVMIVAAMLAFFLINLVDTMALPAPAAAWFAAPGLLYLFAHLEEKRETAGVPAA